MKIINEQELLDRYLSLTTALKGEQTNLSLLQSELREKVIETEKKLGWELRHSPAPATSHYWKKFADYWQSFELFKEKLSLARQGLAEIEFPVFQEIEFPQNDAEDFLDDLEDKLDDLRKDYRKQLLQIIELQDSVERLYKLQVSEQRGEKAFIEKLSKIRIVIKNLGKVLDLILTEQQVSVIKLAVGEYPPPETTRIVSREDNRSDDKVIISEILSKAYLWRGKLLRKADVIVVSE